MKVQGLALVRAGGGVGAITEREWPILEQMVDAIDETLGEDDAKLALGQFKDQLDATMKRVKAAYTQQYGAGEGIPTFATEADAEASGHKGRAIIGGREAEIE